MRLMQLFQWASCWAKSTTVEGSWTWDAVTDYGLKVTRDTDGDGEIDLCATNDVRVWDLAVSNGASITRVNDDGKIVFTADEPAYIEAFEQIYQWRTESKILVPNTTFTQQQNLFGFSSLAFNLGSYMEQFDFEWGILPLPKGPRADEYYWTVQAVSTTLIPKNAADPEGLATLRAFLWREEDVLQSDVLAAHTNSKESAQVFLTANQEWQGQASRLFQNLLGEFSDLAPQIYDGTRSTTATMAELKPFVQNRLDDLFNQ